MQLVDSQLLFSFRAKSEAINRSIFSHCIFELEDTVLGTIDAYFKEHGWTVASLIFDGVHVEARTFDDGRTSEAHLEETMRGAEERVRDEHGYAIQLLEKPLFFPGRSYASAWSDGDVAAVEEEMDVDMED